MLNILTYIFCLVVNRSFDLTFTGKGGVFLYHPFILNHSATTIALWVRYAVKGAKGNFFRGYLYPYVNPKCGEGV